MKEVREREGLKERHRTESCQIKKDWEKKFGQRKKWEKEEETLYQIEKERGKVE